MAIGTRRKGSCRKLANRVKDRKDLFLMVIVRDMWLISFDAPCLRTTYADKPMRRHELMEAIARVNCGLLEEPGGLVVEYLDLAGPLNHALHTYTESGGQGSPSINTAQAIAVMLQSTKSPAAFSATLPGRRS